MLKTYDLIKKLAPKLGENEAKELISFVEDSKGDVVSRADLQSLKADLQVFATKTDLRNEAQTQIQGLRAEQKTDSKQ